MMTKMVIVTVVLNQLYDATDDSDRLPIPLSQVHLKSGIGNGVVM